jgi:glutathione S-transferase
MKLYYSPGACSMAPHIVANESGLSINLEKVDLGKKQTESGRNFLDINPKGQVPTLALDDGTVLTEGPVIAQYIADQAPSSGLIPAAGSVARYQVMEWQNFITSELHKGFSPLFNPKFDASAKGLHADIVKQRLALADKALAGKSYLTGEQFTVADAYLFTVAGWGKYVNISLAEYANLSAFVARVAARPAVQKTLAAEGLA